MTDDQSISDMIRTVAENNHHFFNAIAAHIEKLEARIIVLEQPTTSEEECNDENM